MKLIGELWNYREMIGSLVRRDIRGRYKGSALGILWMLVDPFAQLVIYTVVFSYILKSSIDKFYLFLFVALVPWIFFSQCLNGGSTIIISNQDMVKKIYFPREIIPISFAISQLVTLLLSFVAVIIVVLASGIKVSVMAWICLPFVIIDEFMLGLGVVLITSGLNVYYRDVQYILSVVSLAWMYLTPILYPLDMVTNNVYRSLFYINPLTIIIENYRTILYYGNMPDLKMIGLSTLISFVIMIIGVWCFGRMKKGFAEEL